MIPTRYLLFWIAIFLVNSRVQCHRIDILSNAMELEDDKFYFYKEEVDQALQIKETIQDKVTIDLYYESLCPDCREFITTEFVPVVDKLGSRLNLNTYPFGKTFMYNESGRIEFICQHGPDECYGNELHACAIDTIKNITEAVLFNACMMEDAQHGHGSDDSAAAICGTSMNINPEPILKCAKGDRGKKLLKYYGDESSKVNYHEVPYVLINGVERNENRSLMLDICKAFKNPPPACA